MSIIKCSSFAYPFFILQKSTVVNCNHNLAQTQNTVLSTLESVLFNISVSASS